jgi:long-chain acyl-CoA synthetase
MARRAKGATTSATSAVSKERTLPVIFQNRVETYGDRVCVKYKKNGAYYADISWKEMNEMVSRFSFYLLKHGVQKGDKIALFSENRYEWWVADLAILSVGAVNVPVYATNSPEEAAYAIGDSEAIMCIVSGADILSRVLKVKRTLKKLKNIIVFEDPKEKKAGIVSFANALSIGGKFKNKDMLKTRIKAVKPSDLATIIYTSGTTGNPKGVMLTQDNFVSQCEIIFGGEFKDVITNRDVFLSFLPLSHALERTAGYYGPLYTGCTVAFAQSVQTLLEDMKEIRPTVLISVPRIYEKLRAGILSTVAASSALKRGIFSLAFSTARKNLPYTCAGKPRRGLFAKRYNLLDKIVFSALKERLGLNRLHLAVSGGGPLSISDAEFFVGMEIQVLEGYGLTETSPVTHVNREHNIKPGSVGHIIPETEIKLSDEGEIFIKGRQLMAGYYKNPKATKEAMTKDGFLKTGDIGVIDETGRLTITGRVKDIIITAGGKNISPQNIENSLKNSRFIEQAAVIGDRRKYLSALIVPAFLELEKWAAKNGISFSSRSELLADSRVNAMLADEISKNMKHYARVEQIRNFKLLDTDWSQETGELTPSLKVKRRVVETKYSAEIESMYPPDSKD